MHAPPHQALGRMHTLRTRQPEGVSDTGGSATSQLWKRMWTCCNVCHQQYELSQLTSSADFLALGSRASKPHLAPAGELDLHDAPLEALHRLPAHGVHVGREGRVPKVCQDLQGTAVLLMSLHPADCYPPMHSLAGCPHVTPTAWLNTSF